MATLLLDTSVIIDAINGKRNRNQLLKELLYHGHLLACCPINVTEVYAGLRAPRGSPNPEPSPKPAISLFHQPRASEAVKKVGSQANTQAKAPAKAPAPQEREPLHTKVSQTL